MIVNQLHNADGTASYEVDYRYNGRRRRRRFGTVDEAEGFTTALADICRRWPFQALVDRLGLKDKTEIARHLKVHPSSLAAAHRDGLDDEQADTWAVRAGYHPVEVWGWDWIAAGHAFAHLDTEAPSNEAAA